MNYIIILKFRVTNYQNQYEFQSYGSLYNYRFIQYKGSPELDLSNKASYKEFVDYQGVYISAILPAQIKYQLEKRTIIALLSNKDYNTIKQLATLVRTLQYYVYTESYYLYTKKSTLTNSEKFY